MVRSILLLGKHYWNEGKYLGIHEIKFWGRAFFKNAFTCPPFRGILKSRPLQIQTINSLYFSVVICLMFTVYVYLQLISKKFICRFNYFKFFQNLINGNNFVQFYNDPKNNNKECACKNIVSCFDPKISLCGETLSTIFTSEFFVFISLTVFLLLSKCNSISLF